MDLAVGVAMTPPAPGVMLTTMHRNDPRSSRLASRGILRSLSDRGRSGWRALGCFGVLACGQAGLVEPEVPAVTSRLLVATAPSRVTPEVLHASVEIFGLQIASLDSSVCRAPSGAASVQTEVEAAPLVKAIRRTSGEARTELLGSGGLPASSDYTFRDGDVVRHYQVDYRAGGYAYVYDNGGVERRTGVNEIPEGAEPHDMHSAMLLLRAWRPRLDEARHFYVVLGRRPWRVDVTARGPEVIKLGEDPRLTHRIDGVAERLGEGPEAPAKHFSLWLSEGAERAPLRMVADASFGQVTLTLTGREAIDRQCSPPPVAAGGGQPREAAPAASNRGERTGWIGSAWSTARPATP